jgi:hypothetical protein
MIPILGVPILNGFHWLERLVNSIDFPIDKLVVINNNSEDTELLNQLNTLSAKKFDYINSIHICHLPSNIGVGSAWNLIIKSSIDSPYWLISNHDIAFTSGLLVEFFNKAQQEDIGIIYSSKGDFGIGSYDIFLIKDWVVQKIGLFDENFYPAYCEDVDYTIRLYNYNLINSNDIIKTQFLNIPYYHGTGLSSNENCYLEHGQQTAKNNIVISNRLNNAHYNNFNYMYKKWGDGWRNMNPQQFPFGIENIPLTYTSYDLEFCRSKTLNLKQQENKMEFFYNDSHPDEENGIIDTNQFIVNSNYNPRIFVVDNFYQDPIAIREFALNQKYFPGEGAVGHRTKKQFLFDGLKQKFEHIIGQPIPDHTDDGYGWRDIGINGRFQYCPAGSSLVYHCDVQKWAAMIFLTPDAPPSAGTSFFRHKDTKIYHNSQIDWNTNGNIVFNQKTFLDRTPYELTDNVSNVFNRLVIFDGGLIHSASDYFGWDINSSRLFHIFFFN